MNKRNILLSGAAAFVAGYSAYRGVQALIACIRPSRPLQHDAAQYGAQRRALAISGIARSLAAAGAVAFGPAGKTMERNVQRLPVWLQPSAFAMQAALLDALVELPIEFVEGHELERRYGLSEQSVPSWLSDYAKQQLIGSLLTTVLSGFLGAALRRWPRTWPYAASAAAVPLLLAGNLIVPIYILPLFNTYEPLEGPLEERLRALASRFGVGDAQILRVDMSKQTKKANAFVIGIGKTHRIVVGDTLIEQFTPEEIEFVVAHELGHYVAKDTWRLILAAQISTIVIVFGAFAALGTSKPKQARRPRTLAKIQFLALLFSQILRPAMASFSRSREWAADRFAVAATGDPATGASAFRRLRDQNLAEDEQPAWYELIFATHPSLKARIAALEEAARGYEGASA